MIFQDPYSPLNPRLRAWQMVAEAVQVCQGLSRHDARAEALRLLNSMEISNKQANRSPKSLALWWTAPPSQRRPCAGT
ncbi:MAG TPA: hypothetical protein DEP84_12935 [Chloroflexi bacterium]|nr:hypothetical protein [Chloroflexota bacterium]